MSLRRRIQTDVPETEDPDRSLPDGRPGRTGTYNVPETDGQDGWAHHLGFPSQGHPCVPSALALRFGDGCHRRMSLRRMTETEGHDGCHRQMSPRPKVKTEIRRERERERESVCGWGGGGVGGGLVSRKKGAASAISSGVIYV